jgi:hypothetical protein
MTLIHYQYHKCVNMLAVKLVILIAFFAKIHHAITVFAQNTIDLQVIPGTELGTCASQEDVDAAKQQIHSAASSTLLQQFGNHNTVSARCGPGQWYRVAYLDMSDPTQQCPPSLRLYSASGVRACGRPSTIGAFGCSSLTFTSGSGRQYSKVCGQVIGHQVGSTDVFSNQRNNSIDTGYVDGVSITHGSMPRRHIWTYAAGISEQLRATSEIFSCPCALAGSSFMPQTPPSYVGNNYYCESGNPASTFEHTDVLRYTSDPLWDGQQCEGQCCSDGRTPPWFSVTLTSTTSDDIEVRICGTEPTSNEDTPISLMEVYVQ